MEVKLPALLGNYDRQTDRHATDRPGHREVTLPLSETKHTYERTDERSNLYKCQCHYCISTPTTNHCYWK